MKIIKITVVSREKSSFQHTVFFCRHEHPSLPYVLIETITVYFVNENCVLNVKKRKNEKKKVINNTHQCFCFQVNYHLILVVKWDKKEKARKKKAMKINRHMYK